MLRSLHSKILFFVTAIMAVTAISILYFTKHDVSKAMLTAQEASVENDFHFVELNIKQVYGQLLTQKVNTIGQRKQQLKSLSDLAVSVLNKYLQFAQTGAISSQQAQERALAWLRETTFEQEIDWFVFDSDALVISSNNREMERTDISSLKDIKERNISSLYRGRTDEALSQFDVFDWRSPQTEAISRKLGYFTPFQEWQWTLVTVIDISDVETETQQLTAQSIKALKESFNQIRIAGTGSVFLFDADENILIPPASPFNGPFWSEINPETGNHLLKDLMTASQSTGQTVKLKFPVNGGYYDLEVHVSYFKSFNWYTAFIIPLREITLPARTLIRNQSLVIAVIFLFSIAIMYLLVSRIVLPLRRLELAAKEIPTMDFTSEEQSNYSIDDLADKRRDEVGRLAQSFVFMKSELKNNIRNLMETTATKERIQGELTTARKLQMGILPKIFPPFPNNNEFDLYATLEPAKEMGGDLYDFFFIDDHRLCFTLGDVSDKGVPAALYMVITRTLVKTSAQQDPSPALMMEHINDILGADNPTMMFVTLIIGILDIRTGEIRYANGGHNPPVLITENEVSFQKGISGPMVGVMPGTSYRELHLQLGPDDKLFLYTDGVTEAMNERGEVFSDAALLDSLNSVASAPLDEVFQTITGDIQNHVGNAPQSDDIAMMMLRYNGPPAGD